MSKRVKKWFIIGAVLTALGILTLFGVIRVCDGDYSKLDTAKQVENTIVITDDFNDIQLDIYSLDIEFVLNTDEACKVYSIEQGDTYVKAVVEDGVLKITEPTHGSFVPNIRFNYQDKLVVYLPKSEYNTLNIDATTSDINVLFNFYFNDVKIKNTTGDVYCNCNVVNDTDIKSTTGDVVIKNNLSNKLNIALTTGDVMLDNIDPEQIFVKTTTGDIEGTLLSDKIFKTKTSTGNIKVPNTSNGGLCNLETTTGDIKINIKQ